MFYRLVLKSLIMRRGRLAVAVVAVLLGATLVTALTTLSLDIQDKASRELRAYGANLVLLPEGAGPLGSGEALKPSTTAEGSYLKEEDLAALASQELASHVVGYAPYLYAVVELRGQSVVLAGTWLDHVPQVSPWWRVEGAWPESRRDKEGSIVGTAVAQKLNLALGDSFMVTYGVNSLPLRVAGIVDSGGSEDNQVFVGLAAAQELVGWPGMVSLVQVSALGRELESTASLIQKAVPGSQVRVVGQIARAEESVMGKVQFLLALVTALVLGASFLAVLGTMTTSVLERTAEMGLMKALGAEGHRIAQIFMTEALVIAALGAVLGFGAGQLLVQFIGSQVFGSAIAFHWVAVPVTLGVALVVTIAGSAIPVQRAVAVDPVVTLRGE